jgi:uncharacterized membrane protein YccC
MKTAREILIVAAAIAIVAAIFDALRFAEVQLYWPFLLALAVALLAASHVLSQTEKGRDP